MTFSESAKTCFGKYATFSGRASRSEYWWFTLLVLLVSLIPVIGTLFSLAALIPSIAVAARRLHDTDRSGWWQIAPQGGVLLTLLLVSIQANILATVAGLATVGMIVALLIWLVREGGTGDNRFGPDPLGAAHAPNTSETTGETREIPVGESSIPTVRRHD